MNIPNKNPHKAIYEGFYYAVIPENMAIPKAMFLSEDDAVRYANGVSVVKCSLSFSLILQALSRC